MPLLVLLSILAVFLGLNRRLLRESLPKLTGTVPCSQVKAPVQILTSNDGVPIIHSESEADLFFALGYIQARDRLWQMDLLRRAAAGGLAEILGRTYLDLDLFFRELDLMALSESEFDSLSPRVQQLFRLYSEGVNRFISQASHNLPVEFSILNYQPLQWKPTDCLSIWQLYRWMNSSFARKLIENVLQRTLKPTHLELFDLKAEFNTDSDLNPELIQFATQLVEIQQQVSMTTGLPAISFNFHSNHFTRILSDSSGIRFAFAPMGVLTIPSIWYLQRLICADYQVWGCTVPGLPLLFSGTNGHMAWGIEPAKLRDVRIDLRDFDSDEETVPSDQVEKFTSEVIAIPVAAADTVWKKILRQENRILFSGFHDFNISRKIYCDWAGTNCGSGLENLISFLKINSVDSVRNFFSAPHSAANCIYGIGRQGVVRVFEIGVEYVEEPLRKKQPKQKWMHGERKEAIFREIEYVPYNQFSPPVPTRQVALPDLQMANTSLVVGEVMSFLEPFLTKLSQNPRLKNDLYFLLNWKYNEGEAGIGLTLFNLLINHIIENIFNDEMGAELFRLFRLFPERVAESLLKILHDPDNIWLDDVTSPDIVETMEQILHKSALQFHKDVFVLFQSLLPAMQWEKATMHPIPHLLGDQNPKSFILNTKPILLRDGGFPLNSIPLATRSRQMIKGYPLDLIYKMDEHGQIFWQLFPGQSGNPLSPNYQDQVEKWLKREFNRTSLGNTGEGKLMRLIPIKK